MNISKSSMTVLVADDDPDDRFLTQTVWKKIGIPNTLVFVEDGEELMDYLHHRGSHAVQETSPRPGLIFLDLNMPRMDGWEALRTIKTTPALAGIPIIIWTTSTEEEEIIRSYTLGASSFLTKPINHQELVRTIHLIDQYWLNLVHLPSPPGHHHRNRP